MLKIAISSLLLTASFAHATSYQDGLAVGQQSLGNMSQQLSKVRPSQLTQGSPKAEQHYYQHPSQLTKAGKAKLKQDALGQALQSDCQEVHDGPMALNALTAGMVAAAKTPPTDNIPVNCAGQHCWHANSHDNHEFQDTLSKLSIWQMAGQDNFNQRFFNGQAANCREVVADYLNCCQDSGWGKDLHLAKCSIHEHQLGQAKQKHQVVLVGKYCHKHVLGKCVETRKSYCRFHSHLARIIQQNGRAQLHLNFGNPKSPNCQGLSSQQLQQIDLSQMDFREVYTDISLPKPELSNTAKLPTNTSTPRRVQCP